MQLVPCADFGAIALSCHPFLVICPEGKGVYIDIISIFGGFHYTIQSEISYPDADLSFLMLGPN